ncbi:MAG: chorismate mutase [Kingella oralis]
MRPETLNEVRQAIDSLDAELITLLAKRQTLVEQAGRLKPRGDRQAVAAPERVAQVIAARRGQATAAGLSPEVAEAVWQAMIAAFIRLETETNQAGTFAKPQI